MRALQKAVERFGRGDLTARVGSTRRDELGQLARTFDRMAERIETLLAAERRLLLDISHELRSPLARLGVAVELARSGDDLDSALNRIQKESDRLNSLVGQLLQVTRAEGDPNSLRHNPVRLDVLVQQLVDDSTIEAAARGCSLQYEKHDAGDGGGRSRVAAPRGGERDAQCDPLLAAARLRSTFRWRAATARRWSTFAIADPACRRRRCRGCSILSTASRTIAGRNSGGIGLGLSIARRAIELHKGSIRARNADAGAGSRAGVARAA